MEYLDDVTDEDIQEAVKRLYKVIHYNCLLCEKDMKESNMLQFRLLELKKEPIASEKNQETNNKAKKKKDDLVIQVSSHMICLSCYRIERAKEKQASKEKNKGRLEPKCLECKICYKKHYIDCVAWEEDDGACCTGPCILF